MLKFGIDVSYANGKLNWESLYHQNPDKCDFVIVRAGYGNNNIDAQARHNLKMLNDLGIPAGVYWFSYAFNEKMAVNEAQRCIDFISKYKIEYPVIFDFEYDSVFYARRQGVTIKKSLASNLVREFCNTVERLGYYAMFYTNLDYKRTMFSEDLFNRYDHWLAYYNSNDKYNAHLTQYTSRGRLTGFYTNFDLNRCDRNYPELIKKAGLNNL